MAISNKKNTLLRYGSLEGSGNYMGSVASAIFAGRSIEKFRNGDSSRGVIAGCQIISSADSAAKASSSVFGKVAKNIGGTVAKADGAVDVLFNKIGGETGTSILNNMSKTTGAASKIGAVAQSAINPLLCVSAGIRVLKDDDQYARLIEETSAMGMMFGTEAVMKCVRNGITGQAQATKGLSGKVANVLSNNKNTSEILSKLKKGFDNIGKSKNGNVKQTLLKVGLDVLFVGGSILAFNVGQKIGKKLSHRDENSQKQ